MLIRGDNMELSYNNLWKTLIDKKNEKKVHYAKKQKSVLVQYQK